MAQSPAARIAVNGVTYEFDGDVRRSLLDFLRRDLGLTGTKKGCDHGQCGACTVHFNGAAIRSCVMPAAGIAGSEITTITSDRLIWYCLPILKTI